MKIKRVEHIAIAVNSLKQSMDLLRNTFGIPLEYEEQIGATRLAMLPVGETYIELLESKAPESGVNQVDRREGRRPVPHLLRGRGHRRRARRTEGEGREAARRDAADRPWRRAHRVHRSGVHRQSC